MDRRLTVLVVDDNADARILMRAADVLQRQLTPLQRGHRGLGGGLAQLRALLGGGALELGDQRVDIEHRLGHGVAPWVGGGRRDAGTAAALRQAAMHRGRLRPPDTNLSQRAGPRA
jgi:hypothetical protein